MPTISFILAACFILLGSTSAASATRSDDDLSAAKQQVLDLEKEWVAAEVKHDANTLRRILDDKFIVSFGAKKPYDKEYGPKNIAEKAPNGIEYELKRLYYDIAGTAYRPAIAALTSLVPTTQILFGSDNPFVPLADTAEGMKQLGFSAENLLQIGRENALGLMPRLRGD